MGNLLSVIVGFGYLAGALPAGLVLRNAQGGLRRGMLWASCLNLISGALRCVGGGLRSFWCVFLGQLLVGVAQPFFMAAPAQLSAEWFPAREHGQATSIAILSQVLGQAVIFLIGPSVGSLTLLVSGQAVASAALLLLIWFLFGESPLPTVTGPTAVTSGGAADMNMNKNADVDAKPSIPLMLNRDFGVLSLVSAVCIGAFWTLCTIIGHVLMPLGYSEEAIGVLGFSFIGFGMAGLLVAGPLMDRTKAFRSLMLACVWAASLSSVALMKAAVPSNFPPLLAACSVLGFWLTAIQAVALETATEISFPTPESTSSGVIFGAAVGVYCALPFLALRLTPRAVLSAQCALFTAMALLLSVCFRPEFHSYRRLAFQKGKSQS